MSKIKFIALVISGLFLLMNSNSFGQHQKKVVVIHKGNGHGKGNHHGPNKKKVVIVHKSKFRPAKVVVYHPVWAPKKNYNRRWVYFPKYHCYWDNWRNVYFYKNGNVWVSSAQKPTIIVNVNLENEYHYELEEADDDNDEIYTTNVEKE
jgi:hypothetical protein